MSEKGIWSEFAEEGLDDEKVYDIYGNEIKDYDGPTWDELEMCGHSPRMIESILAEAGYYDN
tara:strand:+ start:970 stop:1155 length:186 start_codon:yes stop_codon:yes gene_type:complete